MTDNSSLLTGSTSRLLNTFLAKGIACEVVDGGLNLVKYQTKDGEWRLLRGMLSEKLPLFSKQMCDNKWWTRFLLTELGLPSPMTIECTSEKLLRTFIAQHKTVVTKPRSGAHGHGVTMNVTAETDLSIPIRLAKSFDTHILAQQQITGTDIRLLVVGSEVISAVERKPAEVIGDGTHTVAELITIENQKPERGKLGIDTLVEISLPAVKQFLTAAELSRVPVHGEVVRVVGPSNQSMGGTVHDVIDRIPSSLRDDTLRLTSYLKMPIAGVDCILTSSGYYFLEVNASPGIAIHDDPALGIESGCFKVYMQLLHEDIWWRDSAI